MCLYTASEKVQVAKEDIICYKILVKVRKRWIYRIFHKSKYRAPFSVFYTYQLKKLYDLGKSLRINFDPYPGGLPYHIVDEGFHSFVNLQDAKRKLDEWYEAPEGQTIVKCVIPKGAEYVKGTIDSSKNSPAGYVSHQIICLKEV